MATFEEFVQTELPKRPFTEVDGTSGQVLCRSGNPLHPLNPLNPANQVYYVAPAPEPARYSSEAGAGRDSARLECAPGRDDSRDSGGWVMFRRVAARRKFSSSATATKARRCWSSKSCPDIGPCLASSDIAFDDPGCKVVNRLFLLRIRRIP